MKISVFSDLHLNFLETLPILPEHIKDLDIVILAGDLFVLPDFGIMKKFLGFCQQPLLYCFGNHEFYGRPDYERDKTEFRAWAAANMPNLHILDDEEYVKDNVAFFGGTMWTDLRKGNPQSILAAKRSMPDFHYIRHEGRSFLPEDSILLHNRFKDKLHNFFVKNKDRKKVVFTHHAPIRNANSPYEHYGNELNPCFVCTDMDELLLQSDVWVYGHSHVPDSRMIGETLLLSNPLGYPGEPNCSDFDPSGLPFYLD